MSLLIQVFLEQIKINKLMYANVDTGRNKIGGKGCYYLSMSYWNDLKIIVLCRCGLIKVKIRFPLRDAGILPNKD